MSMKIGDLILILCGSLCLNCFAETTTSAVYKDPNAPVEKRVSDLLSRLTLQEKTDLCHGNFLSGGVPRLGIGQLKMLDGRQGLRPVDDQKGTRTTLMPCALSLSCTWDTVAAANFGKVLAEEMLAMDRHVLLAPMLNLVRSPLGGRNFENFGEDPLLVGQIGSAYIQGVQKMGVGACSCLLVANDCEARRHFTSSHMDERTLRELHLVGYEMSVREGGVWSMMTGNNLFNGIYCAQNHHLVQDLIKDSIGFDGVMITDWRGAYDTVPTALAGTDMTTGFCSYVFGDGNLMRAVEDGTVSRELLDDKVRRVLRLYIKSGVLDPGKRMIGKLDTAEHRQAARQIAAEGMVLLKNDNNILPLHSEKIKTIMITGPASDRILQGGGSGNVPAAINITPFDGLKTALDNKAKVIKVPFKVNLSPRDSKEWVQEGSGEAGVIKNNEPNSEDEFTSDTALIRSAKSADVVVFVAAGNLASEGRDLQNMELPGNQAKGIAAIADVNPNIIVVLVNNGAISLDGWGEKVSAILAIHYSGEATGDALADVLTGKVNPSGKLSYTFGKQLNDYACHALGEWPAKLILDKDPVNAGFKKKDRRATHAFTTEYNEGVFSGYRWFDSRNIEPAFPFGFGLSYTSFEMKDLKQQPNKDGSYTVSCSVTNTGKQAGSEIVQVYVAPGKSGIERPQKELKGFAKVMLQPGESRVVEIPLRRTAFAYYDSTSQKWKTEVGDYPIEVGNSSRDVQLKTIVSIEKASLNDGY